MTFIKAPCEACQRELADELSQLSNDSGVGVIDFGCLHHGVGIEIAVVAGAVVNWATYFIHDEADFRRLIDAKHQLQPGVMNEALALVKARKTAH